MSLPLWSKGFVRPDYNSVSLEVKVDSNSNILLLTHAFNIDFGGGPVLLLGLVKFDPNGNHLWTRGYGNVRGNLAVDSSGASIICGSLTASVSFGGASLGPNGVYVAKIDASGGHVWSKVFTTGPSTYIHDCEVDSAGNIYLGGRVTAAVNFGGATLSTSSSRSDLFVVKLDPSGNHLWSRQGGAIAGAINTVSVDGAGNPVFLGYAWSPFDLGTGQIPVVGGSDVFIVRMSPSGGVLNAGVYGDTGLQTSLLGAAAPNGNVAAVGDSNTPINFGGGDVSPVFYAVMSSSLNHLGSKSMGPTSLVSLGPPACDPNSNAYFAGRTSTDALLVKVASDGTQAYQNVYGGSGDQYIRSVAFGGGTIVVAGTAGGSPFDLGYGPILSGSAAEFIFLARLAP